MKLRLLLAFAMALGHGDPASAGSWAFLMPGAVHVGEAPEAPGHGWLALHRVGSSWRLSPTRLTARRVESAITEYDVEISSTTPGAMAFMRLPGLRAGPVKTPKGWERFVGLVDLPADASEPDDPANGIRFNGTAYRLDVKPTVQQVSAQGDQPAYELRSSPFSIVAGTRRTEIGESGATNDSDDYNHIVWMGDLDGDGRLDFIISNSGKNSGGLCLYLSRGAKAGELLQAPYCHIGTGC
ncbi:hypothetical protein DBR42_05655 [Pelomonas sp. HMWF004]|nr:hypothetical protein DBR42_05655 [Pelomonas sp. HMWF004]